MKKMLERLHLGGDRGRLLVSVCAVALVLIAAMLIPLAFRAAPQPDDTPAPMTLEERTQMFAEYWERRPDSDGSFTVEKPDPVPRQMKETCETVMRTVIARSIDDRALDDPAPTGSEYTIVSDETGREIHVCRMWLEVRGDWQNWLDVCFDAETGELYYYYLSRENLTNRKLYRTDGERTGAADIAEQLAAENGWTLRYLTQGENGVAAAVYSSAGGTLCYEISCRVYDALTDIKISCR